MIVTEAGVDPKVSAVVYVAARAPDAGEDYTALAKKFPTPPASAGIVFDGDEGRLTFAVEMTTASCTCASCRRVSAVGALYLYGGAIGSVLRCPSCEALVLCITSGPKGHFIELRGILHVGQ